MTRADAVARAVDAIERRVPDPLIIACNGMIGRELYTQRDAPGRFYMIGSMGLAASIGLGLALTRPSRCVVVFDGDGNLLMGLGGVASVAAAGPANFYHVVFDNAAHGSTGDQRTVSDRVPLERVAQAAGYARASRLQAHEAVDEGAAQLLDGPGPAMLLIPVPSGNVEGIGRVDLSPTELAARFRAACTAG
jgi:thiamine pyrophosphate-dependent acetolactate synthase large subunit-like protein